MYRVTIEITKLREKSPLKKIHRTFLTLSPYEHMFTQADDELLIFFNSKRVLCIVFIL